MRLASVSVKEGFNQLWGLVVSTVISSLGTIFARAKNSLIALKNQQGLLRARPQAYNSISPVYAPKLIVVARALGLLTPFYNPAKPALHISNLN